MKNVPKAQRCRKTDLSPANPRDGGMVHLMWWVPPLRVITAWAHGRPRVRSSDGTEKWAGARSRQRGGNGFAASRPDVLKCLLGLNACFFAPAHPKAPDLGHGPILGQLGRVWGCLLRWLCLARPSDQAMAS
jgi:hypothetical protein